MQKTLRLSVIAASLAVIGAAWAQTTTTVVATTAPTAASSATTSYIKRTAPRFESFAGSHDNYASLATGLRTGRVITLTGHGETVAFNSPTRPMGYGNITRSLDIAQRQLAAHGITNPTPTQLQAAMMGGTIKNADGTVTTYDGVLKLRADGMGWGKIAQTVNVHPGMGKSAAAVPASSRSGITTAAGGSVAASGKAVGRPDSPGSHGRQISTAAGGNASAHASGRGLASSAGISSAAGASAGGGGNAGGHGHGK